MKTKVPVGQNHESEGGLYLLSAVIFAAVYGLPLLTGLVEKAQH